MLFNLKRITQGLRIIWALTSNAPIINLNGTNIEFKDDGHIVINGKILQTNHDVVLINSTPEFIAAITQAAATGNLKSFVEQDTLVHNLDAELAAFEQFSKQNQPDEVLK